MVGTDVGISIKQKLGLNETEFGLLAAMLGVCVRLAGTRTAGYLD